MLRHAEQSQLRRSRYVAPKNAKALIESGRFSLCDVPTPPVFGSSNGANIHGSTLSGQTTSSSTKMVIRVTTSGMPRHICLRLFASRMLSTRIFFALISLAILVRASLFASMVTRSSSYGSDLRHVEMVSRRESPPVAMVGRIIVTSCEVYDGFSAIGTGLKVQWEMQLTIKRIYRNNLQAQLISERSRGQDRLSFGGGTRAVQEWKEGNEWDWEEERWHTYHAKTAT